MGEIPQKAIMRAVEILEDSYVAEAADAGFDGGEFSGTWHAQQRDRALAELADEYDVDAEDLVSAAENYWDGEEDTDEIQFADPGGTSALRAITSTNPRNLPCPTCDSPNRLTPQDVALGYQCDSCADRLERGGY